MKYKFIHLDGIDKAGKSAIKKELVRLDPSCIVYDRSLVSNLVYSRIYRRHLQPSIIFTMMLELGERHHFVHVKVNKSVFNRRHKKHREKDISTDAYDFHSNEFETVFDAAKAMPINITTIDTSFLTAEEAAKIIYNEVRSNRT